MRIAIICLFAMAGCAGSPVHVQVAHDLSQFTDVQICGAFVELGDEDGRLAKEIDRRKIISPKHSKLVKYSKVVVGMTAAEATCSWGAPSYIEPSSPGDRWAYHRTYSIQYLHVHNGRVIAWN